MIVLVLVVRQDYIARDIPTQKEWWCVARYGCNALHPVNAYFPTVSKPCGSTMKVSLRHLRNAIRLIFHTLSGSSRNSRFSQSLNAAGPITSIPSGMTTLVTSIFCPHTPRTVKGNGRKAAEVLWTVLFTMKDEQKRFTCFSVLRLCLITSLNLSHSSDWISSTPVSMTALSRILSKRQ